MCIVYIASSSMGKQSGARKSSKLIAENIGAILSLINKLLSN